MKALIGYTGFVGTNLNDGSYDEIYNTKNIGDIDGKTFDTLVCSGVSAVKWLANKTPATDWDNIEKLIARLDKVRVEHFVHISTIDVYPDPVNVDEATIIEENPQAYGRHRLRLEDWIRTRFKRTTIIRLPALFGNRLKKNIIFDLMKDNMVTNIDPSSHFQWYNLGRLLADMKKITDSGIDLINISPEPLATWDIITKCFPEKLGHLNQNASSVYYNVRSRHINVLTNSGLSYHLDRQQVMADITEFVGKGLAVLG